MENILYLLFLNSILFSILYYIVEQIMLIFQNILILNVLCIRILLVAIENDRNLFF